MSRAQLAPRWSFRVAVLSEQCDLPPNAKLVLLALDSYRSDRSPMPFPSQATLAKVTGVDPRTVRRMLHLAVVTGWLNRSRRFRTDGGQTTDAFDLLIPVEVAQNLPTPPDTMSAPPGHSVLPPPDTVSDEVVKTLTVKVSKTAGADAPFDASPFVLLWETHVGAMPHARLANKKGAFRAAAAEHGAAFLAAFTKFVQGEDAKYGPEYFASRWRNYTPPDIPFYDPITNDVNPAMLAYLERKRS